MTTPDLALEDRVTRVYDRLSPAALDCVESLTYPALEAVRAVIRLDLVYGSKDIPELRGRLKFNFACSDEPAWDEYVDTIARVAGVSP